MFQISNVLSNCDNASKFWWDERFIFWNMFGNNTHLKHGGNQYIRICQNASDFKEHVEHWGYHVEKDFWKSKVIRVKHYQDMLSISGIHVHNDFAMAKR